MIPLKEDSGSQTDHLDWGGFRQPLVIAHRGAAADAPENTLVAFELALGQGADAIELDVHLSADGVPVVIHDMRLDRTTSGKGLVRKHTAAEIRRLDAGSWFNRRYPAKARPNYSAQRIPMLAEVLGWVRAHQCRVFVEIKTGGKTYPGIEAKVLEEIYRAGVAPGATIMSFDQEILRGIRKLDPGIALGTSSDRPVPTLRRARLLSARFVVPHWALATPRFIRRAHEAGLQVIVWTVNQPRAMRRMLANAVDGIITDYPARLVELRGAVASGKGSQKSRSEGTFSGAVRINM
ncbi:MAG TPA: glycerophosphodiester phosphodiesterase family protein [Terriglobia bacterium]|nr:glycerophosphodiester phosphodiesterase family protein [Terriglobia bacterium]